MIIIPARSWIIIIPARSWINVEQGVLKPYIYVGVKKGKC